MRSPLAPGALPLFLWFVLVLVLACAGCPREAPPASRPSARVAPRFAPDAALAVSAAPSVTPTAPPDPEPPVAPASDAGVAQPDAALRPPRWQAAEPVRGATGTAFTAMDPSAQVRGEPVAWNAPVPSFVSDAGPALTVAPPASDEARQWTVAGTYPGALAVWTGRPRQGLREGITDVFARTIDADGRFSGPTRRAAELTGQLESLEADARGDTVWIAGRALRSVGVFVHAFAMHRDGERVGFVQRLDVVPRAEAREIFVRVVADPDGGAWLLHSGRERVPAQRELIDRAGGTLSLRTAPGARVEAQWVLSRLGTDHRPLDRGTSLLAQHASDAGPASYIPSSATVLWARDALYASVAVGRVRTYAGWMGPGLALTPGAPSGLEPVELADIAVALPPALPETPWRVLRVRAAAFEGAAITPSRAWEAAVFERTREPTRVRERMTVAWAPLRPTVFACAGARPVLRVTVGTLVYDLDVANPDATGWPELLRRLPSEGPSAPRCRSACGLFDDAVAWTGRALVRFDGVQLHRFACRPTVGEPFELPAL